MSHLYRSVRQLAGRAKRLALPRPEVAAWNKARRLAEEMPRFTRGRIELMGYDLEFVDLLTLCPQWNDLFVREAFRASLPETPRILDCGANIGLSVLYFKSRHPGARVTAFEADPAIAEVLRGNLARNGCGDVGVVQAAVWTEEGTVDFWCEGADSGTLASLAPESSGSRVPVPSVRLRRILEEDRIDLLKLDIEGGEEAVLEDCREQLKNVGAILLDLHEFQVVNRSTSRVLDILDSAGFVWSLDDLAPLPWRLPTAAPDSPFPGTHLCWALLVRAWRGDRRHRT